MWENDGSQRLENFWGAFVMTALLALMAWAAGGFYYDLNDDVLIKDILSGVYTGRPEGHTMQILYPLGWLLALLYRIPGIPVFGAFLCLCQFGSIFLIAWRSLLFFRKKWQKCLTLLVQACFWGGVCMEHLVFLQYTVTAGMLITAAIFWLATSDRAADTGSFWKENLPALVLYWIGFCLRSEMGLLLLPLAGAVGFCRWFSEQHPLSQEKVIGYLGLFAALMAGIGLCVGADKLAYSSAEWQEFGRYFDARTTIYDYQRDVVESYEDNREIYEELGISEVRQVLLKNYNFGADNRIDAGLLEALAQKAQTRENGGLFRKDLRTALWELVYGHFLAKADLGLNTAMIAAGIVLFLTGLRKGKRNGLWQVPLLTACACALWMFLILRDRVPARISTPLYLGTAAGFMGLLFAQERAISGSADGAADRLTAETAWKSGAGAPRNQTLTGEARSREMIGTAWSLALAGAVLAVCGILAAPGNMAEVRAQLETRQEANRINEAVLAYCEAHPEYLFLEDVYSTVSFSEKIEIDREKPFNYDLLGGWLVKSPLTDEKLQAFGLESMGEAVCGCENVRLIVETESDFSWLEAFLEEQGIEASVVLEDTIAAGAVEVYRIETGDGGM